MIKTKIDWCDIVWNPVWGCRHRCPYCYARKFASRFAIPQAYREKKHIESPGWTLELLSSLAGHLKHFEPTFLMSNFDKPFPRKSSRIFVNSMSDFYFWKPDWKHMVLRRIRRHPEHVFLFLTKDLRAYELLDFPPNCWLGVTVTRQEEIDALAEYLSGHTWPGHLFISIEPILEPIHLWIRPEWLIIGAETGNRKGKVIPEQEWLIPFLSDAEHFAIPLFMKDNLAGIWQMPLIQQIPEEMKVREEVPA